MTGGRLAFHLVGVPSYFEGCKPAASVTSVTRFLPVSVPAVNAFCDA
jgi:hypothetical protein